MPIRRHRMTAADYRQAVLDTNPVGYWRLGERSGTVARDEMGRNHGTYLGNPTLGVPGLLTGDPNTAVTFFSATRATIAPVGYPTGNAPRSVAAWITRNEGTFAFSFFTYGGANGRHFTTYVQSDAYATPRQLLVHDGTTGTMLPLAYPNDAAGHFVVFVHNGSGVSVSVDGGALTAPVAMSTDTDLTRGYIAGDIDATGTTHAGYWPGTIDELAVWNRALSAAEVAGLYRIGRGF